jgi:ABC-type polysaccharide/polyol phosphate transport system ATPase subunit
MSLAAPLIEVESIGKRFAMRADKHRGYAMRDLLREAVFGGTSTNELRTDEFWAVQDVSFQVGRGDAVGIIGRNGAGKSTLLRMIAGLLQPDAGYVKARGRLQALIALGTGFSPELSGRDNVLNSAAIHGLSRKKIDHLFDEIIDFAELEDFIDSPTGTYSSGMLARLGFAVAVHMDPEVLLIDEILGVGDIGFQNKCQVRMRQLQASGVTLLLVSHNNAAVLQMCSSAIWLNEGRVGAIGPAQKVVDAYVAHMDALDAQRRIRSEARRVDADRVRQKDPVEQTAYGFFMNDATELHDYRCSMCNAHGGACDTFQMHDAVQFDISFDLKAPPTALKVGLVLYHEDGSRMAVITSSEHGLFDTFQGTSVKLTIDIPDLSLRPGNYLAVTPIQEGQSFLWRHVAARFTIEGDRMVSLGRVHLANTMTLAP